MVSHRTDSPRGSIGNGARALTLVLAACWAAPASAGLSDSCRVPDSYLTFPTSLERTERAIARNRPVRVMMFGPSFGGESAGPNPRRVLEMALEQRLRGANFEVAEERSAGLAEEDFVRLRTVVAIEKPDLVIWQVGVRDAMASSDIEGFETALDKASSWMERRGIDFVLVDPPFVPQIAHERIYIPYVGEIGDMSRTEGVPVLRRYAAMQYWNIEREKRHGRVADVAPRHPCVMELLAEAITRATAGTDPGEALRVLTPPGNIVRR